MGKRPNHCLAFVAYRSALARAKAYAIVSAPETIDIPDLMTEEIKSPLQSYQIWPARDQIRSIVMWDFRQRRQRDVKSFSRNHHAK